MTTLECMYLSVTENSVSVDIIYLVKKKKDDLDIIWIQIDPREILRMMGFAPCPGPCPLSVLPCPATCQQRVLSHKKNTETI